MKKFVSSPRPKWQPVRILSIAGSDSGGGAGLQADIKTVSALGGYAATAVSAVTVQNTVGVQAVFPVPADIVCQQVEAVCTDLRPQAVKISMLPDPALAKPLSELLRPYAVPLVIDPVMIATSGHSLMEDTGVKSLVDYLFPLAAIITPNLEEVRALTGIFPENEAEYAQAARILLDMGPQAVLLKGGHAKTKGTLEPEAKRSADYLLCKGEEHLPIWFSSPHIASQNLHGTGCTLSAAIAFYMAAGCELLQAVAGAKEYIHQAILAGQNMKIGEGHGPVNHFFAPLPCLPEKSKK